jgi:hypothetical protein
VADDIVGQLRVLQQYATGLQNVMAQAQASASKRVEATDGGGAVRVVLGPDGLPASAGRAITGSTLDGGQSCLR